MATTGYGGDKLTNVKGYLNFRDMPIDNPGPKYRNSYTNIRYKPDGRGLHFMKGTTFKISTLGRWTSKGSIVGTALLEVPEVVDGFVENTDEGVKETAGAVGSVVVGIWGGAKTGALASSYTGNPWVIGGATIIGGVAGGILGEEAVEAAIDAAQNAPPPTQQQIDRVFQQSRSFPSNQPKF